jgi:hypothetical protein
MRVNSILYRDVMVLLLSLILVNPLCFLNVDKLTTGRIGISHAYGGVLSALVIDYTVAEHEGSDWTEREVIRAVYPDRDEILVDEARLVTL